MITLAMMIFSYLIAICVPNFGDAITILGATTNSAIGWILPIWYYLMMNKGVSKKSLKIIVAYLVLIFIVISSFIEVGTFVYKKLN